MTLKEPTLKDLGEEELGTFKSLNVGVCEFLVVVIADVCMGRSELGGGGICIWVQASSVGGFACSRCSANRGYRREAV